MGQSNLGSCLPCLFKVVLSFLASYWRKPYKNSIEVGLKEGSLFLKISFYFKVFSFLVKDNICNLHKWYHTLLLINLFFI